MASRSESRLLYCLFHIGENGFQVPGCEPLLHVKGLFSFAFYLGPQPVSYSGCQPRLTFTLYFSTVYWLHDRYVSCKSRTNQNYSAEYSGNKNYQNIRPHQNLTININPNILFNRNEFWSVIIFCRIIRPKT